MARRSPSPAAGAPARRLAAVAVAAALGLPAAGCGGDGDPTRAQDGRVNVTLDDYLIDPQRIRARPGRLSFRAVNRGRIGHTLRVLRGDRELVAIKTLLPGAAGEAAGTFERGHYKLVCILGNHEELGMYGTLTVR
jgi:plastocyanin